MAAKVTIIGGGIVGVACAYELAKRNVPVTLLERGKVGRGCSYGNAGWVVPSFSLPLPMPGAIAKAGKWLLDPDSPFYVKPRLNWDLFCWLTTFARHTTRRHLHYAAKALTDLGKPSLAFYKELDAQGHTAMRLRKDGILLVCDTPESLVEAREEMQIVGQCGVPGRELNRDELFALEPALKGDLVGGVHFYDDASLRPYEAVLMLADLARARGVEIIEDTEVIGLDAAAGGGRIQTILTTHGRMTADQVVIAAGSWSPGVGHMLGIHLPIQPAKGYGVKLEPFDPTPRVSAKLLSLKIAITPYEGYVRLAGTLELAGLDEAVTLRRVEAILRGARKHYNVPAEPKVLEIWRGFRPCSPDGLPIIGRHRRWSNLILAAGHAMLGLTMAPATGTLVADLVEGKSPTIDPTPFSPNRF